MKHQREDNKSLRASHFKADSPADKPIGVKHVQGHGICVDWVQNPKAIVLVMCDPSMNEL